MTFTACCQSANAFAETYDDLAMAPTGRPLQPSALDSLAYNIARNHFRRIMDNPESLEI